MFYEVENMIAGVIGYDSIRKHLAEWAVRGKEIPSDKDVHVHIDIFKD